MSLVNLAHLCSHLQNASKVRLGLTSVLASKLHVALALALQREGLLSSVTLGGVRPPLPYSLQAGATPESTAELSQTLKAQPWDAYPPPVDVPESDYPLRRFEIASSAGGRATVPENVARRRLWLGLKYWNGEPTLKNMKLVSKPTRRIWVTHEDLKVITRGRAAVYVDGLTRAGECMFVTTDRGILESRECVERRLGGMLLCRVW